MYTYTLYTYTIHIPYRQYRVVGRDSVRAGYSHPKACVRVDSRPDYRLCEGYCQSSKLIGDL